MLSMRFSGPVQAIQEMRNAMRPAGATKVGYRANNDGLTARLYVDFGLDASLAILAAFRGGRPEPSSSATRPVPVDQVLIEAGPAPRPLPPGEDDRRQVSWRD